MAIMAGRAEKELRYIPSVAKALEVILWLADQCKGIDVYHLVKASFFADKYHISKYGRPIVGDVYRAAWFGPLPQVIYGLLRDEPMEVLALGNRGPLPFRVEGFCVYPERGPNLDKLSESDVEALTFGLREVEGKTFDQLLKQTHRDPAYVNAGRSGMMDYRDFIPASDRKRQEKIAYLEEVANNAVF